MKSLKNNLVYAAKAAAIGAAVLATTMVTGWMLLGLVVGGAGMYAAGMDR